MKKFFIFLFILIYSISTAQPVQRPKLVVGLVVDQMRWDYLYRFYNRYGSDGFKRIIKEGFSCENTFIPYTPTVTAAGHTCVYTGSVPSLNGIIGNSWYDRHLAKSVYCVDDAGVQSIGSTSAEGKMSPKNLWSTTITDELRMATNFKNKTISIALKDRASILPGGHTANAAYWFDNTTGTFISSSYYLTSLPDWVINFNGKKLPDSYLQQNWNTLYPISTYTQSTADAQVFESNFPGEKNTFPHITRSITSNKYESFRHTPYGNTVTFEMAKAAVEGEHLGQGSETDFLAVSLSSTDYIGHTFGPNSVEVEDTYLRLDKDLASFLHYLDAKIGRGQYLFFLTADHGATTIPLLAKANKIPAGIIASSSMQQQLKEALQQQYHTSNIVEYIINNQIYLNDSVLLQNNLDKKAIKQCIIHTLLKNDVVAKVIDLDEIGNTSLPEKLKRMLANGYNQKLSGDVQYVYKSQWTEGGQTGTTHGAWYPYDAHIPLLWWGWHINAGALNKEVYMMDIAPTIAALLHIQMPNASIGSVIEEVMQK